MATAKKAAAAKKAASAKRAASAKKAAPAKRAPASELSRVLGQLAEATRAAEAAARAARAAAKAAAAAADAAAASGAKGPAAGRKKDAGDTWRALGLGGLDAESLAAKLAGAHHVKITMGTDPNGCEQIKQERLLAIAAFVLAMADLKPLVSIAESCEEPKK